MSSFLKNTGDIILDAVLTDEGRRRLSLGDGSFKITKFALADDEINYGLYDADAAAGSEDTNVMLTPIFEAMTNNAASVKNKLISIARTDLLFLPVLKLNTLDSVSKQSSITTLDSQFIVNVPSLSSNNEDTTLALLKTQNGNSTTTGILDLNVDSYIRIDQGLDTTQLSNQRSLLTTFSELFETEYNISVDDRLLNLFQPKEDIAIDPITIDDDKIATYKVNISTNSEFVSEIDVTTASNLKTISGYQGSRLEFRPISKPIISDYLFSTLGSTVSLGGTNTKIIRTNIRVVGVTTGYSLDIPVILAKKA